MDGGPSCCPDQSPDEAHLPLPLSQALGSCCWSSNMRAHTSPLRTALARWALICAKNAFVLRRFLECGYSLHLSLSRSRNQEKHLLCTYLASEGCMRPAEALVPWFPREQPRQSAQARGAAGGGVCLAEPVSATCSGHINPVGSACQETYDLDLARGLGEGRAYLLSLLPGVQMPLHERRTPLSPQGHRQLQATR